MIGINELLLTPAGPVRVGDILVGDYAYGLAEWGRVVEVGDEISVHTVTLRLTENGDFAEVTVGGDVFAFFEGGRIVRRPVDTLVPGMEVLCAYWVGERTEEDAPSRSGRCSRGAALPMRGRGERLPQCERAGRGG